jgi:PAS domain S-box-containing protein
VLYRTRVVPDWPFLLVFMPLDVGEVYRVLAETTPDAIVAMDEHSRILLVNPAAERLFGYSATELVGMSIADLMPSRYRARHAAGMARYRDTGKKHIGWQGILLPVLTRSEREVPCEISFGEFLSGGMRVFSAVLRNISDRLDAEAKLADAAEELQQQAGELEQQIEVSEAARMELEEVNTALERRQAEYDALANSIPTLTWMANPDGWIFWYNARWYEYTGTQPADMEGWGWKRVHDPAVLPAVLEQWAAAIRTGQPFEMTFPLKGADGHFRPFLTRVVPVRSETGEVVRWFGTNTDVSPEYAARMAAERAASRLRRLQGLTSVLARARTLDDVASLLIQHATEATGAATAMLSMRDDATDEAVMIGETGLPPVLIGSYSRFPLSRDTPSAECLRTGQATFVETREGPAGLLARWPSLSDVWDSVGRGALAALPLSVDGRIRGAMTFTYHEPQAFEEDERGFLFALAAQAAQAIERVEAFAAERRERNRGESIVESITDGFLTFDSEMRFTYVNARAAALLHVSRTELLGQHIAVLPRANESPFLELVESVIADRTPKTLHAYSAITGLWLDLRAYPSEDGGAIAYFQDVSAQRRQQDAAQFLAEASKTLAASSDYRVTLANLAHAAIPRLGDWCAVDLVVEGANDGARSLERVALVHENPLKVVLGAEYTRLYPPDLDDPDSNATAQALAGRSTLLSHITDDMIVAGAKDARNLEMVRGLGLISAIVVPLHTPSGVIGVLTLCSGESGRHYDEQDLSLAEDLAARAATAVERARLFQQAEAANAAKTEFLRMISHELRQPLNAIGGLLELWEMGLRGDLSTEQREDMGRIKRNQQQLTTLIEDLLSFARLEAGKIEIEKVPVPVDSVFSGLVAAMSVAADARGVELRTTPCGDGTAVNADEDRLHQVMVNLVANALKATERGGRIDVWAEVSGASVDIRVRDTGVGISAAMLETIFAPFVQLGRALNQPREGAGLGLAISRGLTEAMGGTLTAESVVGVGSTFTVRMPAV